MDVDLEDLFDADPAEDVEVVAETGPVLDHGEDGSDNGNAEDGEQKTDDVDVDVGSKEPKKKRVSRPQPKLNGDRLCGPRGIGVMEHVFSDLTFQGRGYERADLNLVMAKMQHWAHRMFPKMPFDQALERIEKLGKTKQVQVNVRKVRMGMDVLPMVVDDEQPAEPEVDVFDELMRAGGSPATPPPPPPATTLTEEQQERMRKNREEAQLRRMRDQFSQQQQQQQQAATRAASDGDASPGSAGAARLQSDGDSRPQPDKEETQFPAAFPPHDALLPGGLATSPADASQPRSGQPRSAEPCMSPRSHHSGSDDVSPSSPCPAGPCQSQTSDRDDSHSPSCRGAGPSRCQTSGIDRWSQSQSSVCASSSQSQSSGFTSQSQSQPSRVTSQSQTQSTVGAALSQPQSPICQSSAPSSGSTVYGGAVGGRVREPGHE